MLSLTVSPLFADFSAAVLVAFLLAFLRLGFVIRMSYRASMFLISARISAAAGPVRAVSSTVLPSIIAAA